MNATVRNALLDAWAVLSPISCAGCDADDRALCPACRAALALDLQRGALADGTPVFSALRYSGPARRTILAFKEQGRTDVARALARPLRQALAAALEHRAAEHAAGPGTAVRLTTVPGTRAAFRRRGYDPVALLVARAGGHPVRLLRQIRAHETQKALGQTERSRNLIGSLAARRPGQGSIVVVDDIMTTGATLTEAVRAIRAAGGRVDAAVTLAFTERILPISAVPRTNE
jgi:predicted amidophosphoribosyltransferase